MTKWELINKIKEAINNEAGEYWGMYSEVGTGLEKAIEIIDEVCGKEEE